MTEPLIQTTWFIPFYGLLGAIFTLPWSTGIIRRTGPRLAAHLNLVTTFGAYLHGLFIFSAIWKQPPQEIFVHWFKVADLDLSFALEISSVSIGAIELVTGLSLLAQLFALGYLEKDYGIARFFALMGFFEGAMSGLALSNSLLLSYGWLELLTLSTYLLVGFWYAQPLAITAARDAFLTKRVGDILLLMGVVGLSTLAGSTNFPDLYQWVQTTQLPSQIITLLCLALIAGPIGKCAQFPLHLWLDEAMEAPSPASVLRNSLVVSCGAYVLIKLQPILATSPIALTTLIVIGTITALSSSLVAISQIDIKRALSHSTSAYIGLVFIAVGMQLTNFALTMILAHAIAKALLFMSVGCVISTTNTQDLTEMGGLGKTMPITAGAFAVGITGLIGVVPFSSVEAFSQTIDPLQSNTVWLPAILFLVNALTAFNLTRVFRLAFLGSSQAKTRRAPEVGWQMALPMAILGVITLSVPFILQSLALIPSWRDLNISETLLQMLSIVFGCGIGAIVKLRRMWLIPVHRTAKFLHEMLAYDLYIDRIYRISVVFAVSQLSQFTAWFDRFIVDGSINLLGLVTVFTGQILKYSAPGKSQIYVLTILLGISFLTIFSIFC
jgi:NAD(P)H-quinone oxidoreductase subunit 5